MTRPGPGQAPVHLDLLLSHPPRGRGPPRTSTSFTVQVAPHPGHPRQGVFHPGEFNLQPGLLGLRPPREDIKNDLFPVDHGHVCRLFPLPLLAGSQFIVKDDAVRSKFPGPGRDLFRLSGATEEFLLHFTSPHQFGSHYPDSKGINQFPQLVEKAARFLLLALVETNTHEKSLLNHLGSVPHLEHAGASIRPHRHGSRQKGREKVSR